MMKFSAIGLMSGTSLDGLDICYVHFYKDAAENWTFKTGAAETVRYPAVWADLLKTVFYKSAPEVLQLHSEYGFYLADQVKVFIKKFNIEEVDVIASHGHTVFHNPEKKYTFQLGDGRAIKAATKIPVAYDFRSQDVLMGGNGAPLVPIGDEILFSNHDACLNLGGFSNISFKRDGRRIAFDICPVNIVFNKYAEKLGYQYDDQGKTAASGTFCETVLKELNFLKYYSQTVPKSLGLEWVNAHIFPLLDELLPEDALATCTAHAATQIAAALELYQVKNVLVTGGGVFNTHLISLLKSQTVAEITIPKDDIINYKEALIFAFMGILRLNNENNVLSSATGSTADHCSGLLV